MTKINKILFQNTGNNYRSYMIVDTDMDYTKHSEELLKTQKVPELLSYYMVESKDGHIQFCYDISKCHHPAKDEYSRYRFEGLAALLELTYGLPKENFLISSKTVYLNEYGEPQLAYLPGYGIEPKEDDCNIVIKKSDLQRFIRNCVSDKLNCMTRAGYETPDELVDRISDEVYRMFMTGDFGRFGKQDRFDPISYEMLVNNMISSCYEKN